MLTLHEPPYQLSDDEWYDFLTDYGGFGVSARIDIGPVEIQRTGTHRFIDTYNRRLYTGTEAECEKQMLIVIAEKARRVGV